MERTRPDLDYPDVESMEGVPLAKRGKCSKRQELRQKNEQTTSAYEGLEDKNGAFCAGTQENNHI